MPYCYEGIIAMDHEVVVREKVTERYLLNELDSEVREEFEEHFFDCPECGFDVRAASMFVEGAKSLLTEAREAKTVVAPKPPTPVEFGWGAWLRPAYVAPVLAWL
jgi:hypothetical protein